MTTIPPTVLDVARAVATLNEISDRITYHTARANRAEAKAAEAEVDDAVIRVASCIAFRRSLTNIQLPRAKYTTAHATAALSAMGADRDMIDRYARRIATMVRSDFSN